MKYVIYDYSVQGLTNWSVLLGKDNIKLIDKKENISLYYFVYNNIETYLVILINTKLVIGLQNNFPSKFGF